MKIIDNISNLLGDDLKTTLKNGMRLKIAASCFSIYAFEALKSELSKIDKLEFIFTAPTFIPEGATDQIKREQREFFIPKAQRNHNGQKTRMEHYRNTDDACRSDYSNTEIRLKTTWAVTFSL